MERQTVQVAVPDYVEPHVAILVLAVRVVRDAGDVILLAVVLVAAAAMVAVVAVAPVAMRVARRLVLAAAGPMAAPVIVRLLVEWTVKLDVVPAVARHVGVYAEAHAMQPAQPLSVILDLYWGGD